MKTARLLLILSLTVLPISSSAQSVSPHKLGELINDQGTVYLIKADGRWAFRTPEEFFSYGYTFDMVLPVNSGDLLLPRQGNMRARAGSVVLDTSDQKNYYVVYDAGARKFADPSLTIFMGYNVHPLNKIDLRDYPKGADIDFLFAFLKAPPGTLVYNNGTIYLSKSNGLAPFPSMEVFNSYRYKLIQAFEANDQELQLPILAPMTFRDGTLINDSGTIFLISENKKYGFRTWNGFVSRGYNLRNVISASISGYAEGQSFD